MAAVIDMSQRKCGRLIVLRREGGEKRPRAIKKSVTRAKRKAPPA